MDPNGSRSSPLFIFPTVPCTLALTLLVFWLSDNERRCSLCTGVVAVRRSRLLLGWVTLRSIRSWYLTKSEHNNNNRTDNNNSMLILGPSSFSDRLQLNRWAQCTSLHRSFL